MRIFPFFWDKGYLRKIKVACCCKFFLKDKKKRPVKERFFIKILFLEREISVYRNFKVFIFSLPVF